MERAGLLHTTLVSQVCFTLAEEASASALLALLRMDVDLRRNVLLSLLLDILRLLAADTHSLERLRDHSVAQVGRGKARSTQARSAQVAALKPAALKPAALKLAALKPAALKPAALLASMACSDVVV